MSYTRFARIFKPPKAVESLSDERAQSLASMRVVWVGLALGLDIALYALLRSASGLRPEIMRVFAVVNIGLMLVDLALTHLALRTLWRGYRLVLCACILSEALAATVWIQMTGSVSSYFLVVGFLLILL